MADLPEPLVPAEVDLKGMPYFQLDTERLMASELAAIGTDAENWAAVVLWCRAWQQRPPASLPNDDRVLAAFCRASAAKWRRISAGALRGFVLCDDNRYYHPHLATLAKRAWSERLKYRSRQEKDAERKSKWRAKSASADADVPRDTTRTERGQDAGGTRLREGEGEGEGYPALLEDIPSPSPPPGTPPPEGTGATRLPAFNKVDDALERIESRENLIARQQEELRARNGHTSADEIAAIKAVTDPAAVDDETRAGRTAEGARGEGEGGADGAAEQELELPARGGRDAEGV